MKILKIENENGFFRLEAEAEWKPIDEIDKIELLKLLDLVLDYDVEMDSPKEFSVSNQAHLIIYTGIHEKLLQISEDKMQFKDESERLYLEERKKYSSR